MDPASLLRDALVWDNHGCMPLRPHDTSYLSQLTRYRATGIKVVFLNIGYGEQGIEEHVRMLAALRHWLSARPDDYVLIDTIDDIERAHASGRLAVGFDIEGANAVADQPSLVQLYYDLGVRWMAIAYNRSNRVGGGCQEADGGLTAFGRELLAEMCRVGMVPCVSHTGHRTARDVCEAHGGPVILSHSNSGVIHPHPRNVPDDLIRAVAATGGTVGINGIGNFLGHNDASTETFLRHLDHAVQLVGPSHVALGLDYVFDTGELDDAIAANPTTFPPELGYAPGSFRLVEPERLPLIVEGMLRLGYADGDVAGILGGNLMRVARTSWKPPTGHLEGARKLC